MLVTSRKEYDNTIQSRIYGTTVLYNTCKTFGDWDLWRASTNYMIVLL